VLASPPTGLVRLLLYTSRSHISKEKREENAPRRKFAHEWRKSLSFSPSLKSRRLFNFRSSGHRGHASEGGERSRTSCLFLSPPSRRKRRPFISRPSRESIFAVAGAAASLPSPSHLRPHERERSSRSPSAKKECVCVSHAATSSVDRRNRRRPSHPTPSPTSAGWRSPESTRRRKGHRTECVIFTYERARTQPTTPKVHHML